VSGEFLLARLPTGFYNVVVTATGRTSAVIAAVPVATPTSIVNVSNIASPIMLPVSTTRVLSGTAVLNPTSATAVAFVAAQQTFGLAPTVTIREVAADDLSVPPGAYSLVLPVAAPLFGQFSSTLPIALSAQAGLAGKYSALASADGYTSQTATADISAANATKNFTLIP
jgi:hypothetical protein